MKEDTIDIKMDSNTNVNTSITRRILQSRSAFLGIIIVALSIAASFIFDAFSTMLNLKSFLLNLSCNSIVAIGMMILLISGAFDLSVGSVFGLAGCIAGNLMFYHQANWILSVFIALIVCIGIGALNGTLISKVGVDPLVATLAMMGLVRGFALIIGGTGIIGLPDGFLKIADSKLLHMRIPIWYMIVIIIIFTFLVSKVVFFRKYYYIGVNEKAANLTGINVVKMRIISFMIASGLAAVAGIILTSRLTVALSSSGEGLELRVITACILGGASLSGGKGSVMGAVMGTIFVALINNLMIIAKVGSYWQSVVIGSILLIAVTADAVLNKSRAE